jgi:Asp-tRNA(Asn)/Glu-tRNA(Gln) amidotransferase A subunit family amidase
MPCGSDDAGLPIGLQITAPVLAEATLFRAARALEADLALELRPSI